MELQLLVIDLGKSCVVKVEKGEWKRNGANQYVGSVTITLPFDRLRKEIDGEKPIPRLERDIDEGGTHIRVMNNGPVTNFGEYAYKVLCEIAGQEIPIYDCGLWTRLTSPRQYGDDDTDIAIWRYRR